MVGVGGGGSGRWWALGLLCVAQFVGVLDINAVVVALPSIGRDLGFSGGDLQQVVTAYPLFFGGFLLLAGRLSDLYGRRRMFAAGLALFALASLSCGFAWSPASLVAFRAVQGLGAAVLAPAALATISTTFETGRERNFAMGVWTAVAAGGGAAGLVVGGLLTDVVGWRSIFLVNVPVGAAGVALSFLLLERDRGGEASRRLDLWGAATATAGLMLLVFGLARAEEAGLGSPVTLGTTGLALGLFGTFVLVERGVPDPLVPLRVFRVGDLSGSAIVAFANTAATGSVGVLVAIYLQKILSFSPTMAGFFGLPFSVSVVVGSFAGARIVGGFGEKAAMTVGLLGICAGILPLAFGISAGGGVACVVAQAVVGGFFLGVSAVASTGRGVSALSEGERGLASGLLNSAAQVGTVLGIAVLFTLAAARSEVLAGGGSPSPADLVGGYRWAFLGAACVAALGAGAALILVRGDGKRPPRP